MRPGGPQIDESEVDIDQIVERLGWTPYQRLQYLLDMLDFEQRARDARLLGSLIER